MDSSTGDEKDIGHNYTTRPELDSDPAIGKAGPFMWSTRQIIAAVSLSILWVGEFRPFLLQVSTHNLSRITGSFILHWWHTVLHGS
jgi:hypothetical protein